MLKAFIPILWPKVSRFMSMRLQSNVFSAPSKGLFLGRSPSFFVYRSMTTGVHQTVNTGSKPNGPAVAKGPQELSHVLRQFYKIVHPDRFSAYPKEKETNEHSMKVFLSYIQEYKRKPYGTPLSVPKRIPLTFFVKSSQDGSPETLRKVDAEILLNASNPFSAKKRLESLFQSCGILNPEFTLESSLDMSDMSDYSTLQKFLSRGLPAAKNKMNNTVADRQRVNGMVADLERRLSTRILMQGDQGLYTTKENIELINRLHKFLDRYIDTNPRLKRDLENVLLNFDSEVDWSTLADDGSYVLGRSETDEEWIAFLKNVDWEKHKKMLDQSRKLIQQNNDKKDKLREQSKVIAEMLGVRKFDSFYYTKFECLKTGEKPDDEEALRRATTAGAEEEPEIDTTNWFEDSMKFLQEIGKDRKVLNPLKTQFKRQLKNLELSYSYNMPEHLRYHLSNTGDLRINIKCSPKEFVDIILKVAARALELTKEERKYSEMAQYVEARLGLKFLSWDYAFFYSGANSLHKIRIAIQNLHDNSNKLKDVTSFGGTMLAISDHYGLANDGCLFIKWDFLFEDAIALLEAGHKKQHKLLGAEEEEKEGEATQATTP